MSQTDTKLKLLGCPFCVKPHHGVSVDTAKDESMFFATPVFWVVCNDCGLKSPRVRSLSSLIAYWNGRVKDTKFEKETLMGRLARILWEPLKWYR